MSGKWVAGQWHVLRCWWPMSGTKTIKFLRVALMLPPCGPGVALETLLSKHNTQFARSGHILTISSVVAREALLATILVGLVLLVVVVAVRMNCLNVFMSFGGHSL